MAGRRPPIPKAVLLTTAVCLVAVFTASRAAIPLAARQALGGKAAQKKPAAPREARSYVGSRACADCHSEIAASYAKTDMGRSIVRADPASLAAVPPSGVVFDQRLNRHFETYLREGELFESEFQTGEDGKDVFRDTRKVEWLLGAGANGIAAIVERGDYLFEAPLSYYTNLHGWALSPGYQFADYGFSRPLLPECIVCHSGRAQPA